MIIRFVNFSSKVINIECSVLIEFYFFGLVCVDSVLLLNRDWIGDGVWYL